MVFYLGIWGKVTESIIIGDNVKITVLGIKGNQARIGIDAPRDVEIWREEIYEKIKREQANAEGGNK